MKKILFPYEKILNNESAFFYALNIARKYSAELIILHVFPMDINAGASSSKLKMQQRWLDIMDEVAALKAAYIEKGGLDFTNPNMKIRYRIMQGDLEEEMAELLSKEVIDLIVFNIPSIEKEGQRLKGEALYAIVKDSNAHVLLVSEKECYRPITKIGYATDLQRIKDSKGLLTFINEFGNKTKSKVHFIHVSDDGDLSKVKDKETLSKIDQMVHDASNRFSFEILRGDDIAQTINKYLKMNQIDLLTVVKQNRNFLSALFHESFINQISISPKEPILILNESFQSGK